MLLTLSAWSSARASAIESVRPKDHADGALEGRAGVRSVVRDLTQHTADALASDLGVDKTWFKQD